MNRSRAGHGIAALIENGFPGQFLRQFDLPLVPILQHELSHQETRVSPSERGACQCAWLAALCALVRLEVGVDDACDRDFKA